MLSDSLLWNTTVGFHRFHNESYPQSGDLQTIGHYNYDTGLRTHNYGNQQYWGSDRNDFTTDLTWFVDDLAGSHEFKGGIEYSGVALPDEGLCNTGTPNGERCGEGVPGFFFYDIEYGGTLPLFMDESQGYPPADYTGQVSTAFVQDAWRVTSDLTLKIGLRYDGVTYDNNEGAQVIDMAMWQPRLGAAWDLTGDAKNILRGSWGRFLHPGNLAGISFATTTPISGFLLVLVLGRRASVLRDLGGLRRRVRRSGRGTRFPLSDGQRGMGPVRLDAPAVGGLRLPNRP